MKPLNGHGDAIKHGVLTAEEALRYAMSLPVATTITGMEKPEILQQNLRVAQNFQADVAGGDAGACATACAPMPATVV